MSAPVLRVRLTSAASVGVTRTSGLRRGRHRGAPRAHRDPRPRCRRLASACNRSTQCGFRRPTHASALQAPSWRQPARQDSACSPSASPARAAPTALPACARRPTRPGRQRASLRARRDPFLTAAVAVPARSDSTAALARRRAWLAAEARQRPPSARALALALPPGADGTRPPTPARALRARPIPRLRERASTSTAGAARLEQTASATSVLPRSTASAHRPAARSRTLPTTPRSRLASATRMPTAPAAGRRAPGASRARPRRSRDRRSARASRPRAPSGIWRPTPASVLPARRKSAEPAFQSTGRCAQPAGPALRDSATAAFASNRVPLAPQRRGGHACVQPGRRSVARAVSTPEHPVTTAGGVGRVAALGTSASRAIAQASGPSRSR